MGIKKKDILVILESNPKREFSFDELVERLMISTKPRKKLFPHLQSLVNTGEIKKTENGKYIFVEAKLRKPKTTNNRYNKGVKDTAVGRFVKIQQGFGFVISPDEEEDIFVDKQEVLWNGIMHGDVIRVEKTRERNGKTRGKFVEFVLRRDPKIIGRVVDHEGGFAIEARSTGDVVIIQHGRLNRARRGDWVEVEIKKWPAQRSLPYGEVIKIIDQDSYVVISEYKLRDEFPPIVMSESEKINEPPQDDKKYTEELITDERGNKRKNLSGIVTVTIDGADAKDFDDAVACQKEGDNFRLFVSIADVSHYILVNTELDTEALERTTSVYFPERAIPMLPHKISNDVCCLRPLKYRYTMTAEILFDKSGTVIKSKIYPSVIKSFARLTYEQAQEMIDKKGLYSDDIRQAIETMYELYVLLRKKSVTRGTVFLDIPEPKFEMDAKGNIVGVTKRPVWPAHSLIEEFMISANVESAKLMKSKGQGVYRVHLAPSLEKLKEYSDLAGEYKVHFDMAWNTAKDLSNYIKKIANHPAKALLNKSLLRSLKKANYSNLKEDAHFALALKDYAHFTSPIRRYPDLMVHRLIKGMASYKDEDLKRICELCSTGEVRAMEAERSITKIKQARYIENKIGKSFDGEISGISDRGMFIELKDVFIEGFLPFSSLSYERLIFDRTKMAVFGKGPKPRFKLGDKIKVTVTDVDVFKGEITFGIRSI